MPTQKQMVCIGCPMGCPLQLTHEGNEIVEIAGYECNRGAKYARQEFTDPRRSLSTTVPIVGARWQRLPVKVTNPIPKERILEAVALIHAYTAQAPVGQGQVLIDHFLGDPSCQVVATRSMANVATLKD